MTFFNCRLLTTPIFPRRLSSVLSKFSHKKIGRVSPLPRRVSPGAIRPPPYPLVMPLPTYIGLHIILACYQVISGNKSYRQELCGASPKEKCHVFISHSVDCSTNHNKPTTTFYRHRLLKTFVGAQFPFPLLFLPSLLSPPLSPPFLYSHHRRSQDFLWGCSFFLDKIDELNLNLKTQAKTAKLTAPTLPPWWMHVHPVHPLAMPMIRTPWLWVLGIA